MDMGGIGLQEDAEQLVDGAVGVDCRHQLPKRRSVGVVEDGHSPSTSAALSWRMISNVCSAQNSASTVAALHFG